MIRLLYLLPIIGIGATVPISGSQFWRDKTTEDLVIIDSRDGNERARFDLSTSHMNLASDYSLQLTGSTADRVQIEIGDVNTYVGTTDSVTYTYPRYRLGRIVNGPYGPQLRLINLDAVNGEKAVMVWERSGTVASSRSPGDPGSNYEAFYEGETYPTFRLATGGDGQYLEFRHNSSDTNDYLVLRRDGATSWFQIYTQPSVARGGLDFAAMKNGDNAVIESTNTITPLAWNAATIDTAPSPDTATWSHIWGNSVYIDLATAAENVQMVINNRHTAAQFLVLVKQHASAARTLTWPTGSTGPGGSPPALTTTLSGRTLFQVVYDGTNHIVISLGDDV